MPPRAQGERDQVRRIFVGLLGLTKILALFFGLPLTVLCLMSLVGLFSSNLWAQLIPAILVALSIPLVIVERFLRDSSETRAWPVASDVLALTWIGFPALFVVAAFPWTSSLLLAEGDALKTTLRPAAQVAYWLGRAHLPAEQGPVVVAPPSPAVDDGDMDGGVDGGMDGGADASEEPAMDGSTDGPVTDGATERPVLTMEELESHLRPHVVTIVARDDQDVERSGSGVLVDRRGTVLTCAALLSGSSKVALLLDGRWTKRATELSVKEGAALAKLHVPELAGLAPAWIQPPTEEEEDSLPDEVVLVGNLTGRELATDVIAVAESAESPLQLTRAGLRGSLCAPAWSSRGELLGVSVATEEDGSLVPAARIEIVTSELPGRWSEPTALQPLTGMEL